MSLNINDLKAGDVVVLHGDPGYYTFTASVLIEVEDVDPSGFDAEVCTRTMGAVGWTIYQSEIDAGLARLERVQ